MKKTKNKKEKLNQYSFNHVSISHQPNFHLLPQMFFKSINDNIINNLLDTTKNIIQ